MAMTLRLDENDDRLLTERARSLGRSKQEIAREAIHSSLTNEVGRLEDLQDEPAGLTQAAVHAKEVAHAQPARQLSGPGAEPRPGVRDLLTPPNVPSST